MSLSFAETETQSGLNFPASLSAQYEPQTIAEFAGLEKQKAILTNFAKNPYQSAWIFYGASGTGKTTMAKAFAREINAEVHFIPSQEFTLDNLQRVCHTCHYVPMTGKQWHVVIADEADRMSPAAQIACLSKLDPTGFPPRTIFIFTSNDIAGLEKRFLSRCKKLEFSSYGLAAPAAELLEKVWTLELVKKGKQATAPNFARLIKDSQNNVRDALQELEMELLAA